jgi:peroxiredoxin
MKKRYFLLMLLSFICVYFFSGINQTEASGEMIEGEKAADFTLKTVDEKVIKLSDFNGKVVVINFWTTWCAYCQEEMDELIKFSGETKSANVELLGVNVTSAENNIQAVSQFVNGLHLPFHIVLDVKGEVSKQYQVLGIPTTYIIDGKGIVRKKILGPVTAEMLKNVISKLD